MGKQPVVLDVRAWYRPQSARGGEVAIPGHAAGAGLCATGIRARVVPQGLEREFLWPTDGVYGARQ